MTKHLSQLELLEYIDGELSQAEFGRVRQHVSECFDCESRIAELEITLCELATLLRIEPLATAEAQLRARSSLANRLRQAERYCLPLERSLDALRTPSYEIKLSFYRVVDHGLCRRDLQSRYSVQHPTPSLFRK